LLLPILTWAWNKLNGKNTLKTKDKALLSLSIYFLGCFLLSPYIIFSLPEDQSQILGKN